MRRKLITKLGILGLAAIFLLSMASYSSDQAVTTQGKPNKPDKPDKPKTEWIEFIGDLVGHQAVDGCCPNAGPFPEYTMWLNFDMDGNTVPGYDRYDGQLFINNYGAGRNRQYIVQFWKKGTDVAIEIIGGVIDFDKRSKILTVTFTDEPCMEMGTGRYITTVNFTLVRRPY
jgi:hypothetical protein